MEKSPCSLLLDLKVGHNAASAGSAVVAIGRRLGLSPTASAFLGGSLCFALRVISVWRHWNLPRLTSP